MTILSLFGLIVTSFGAGEPLRVSVILPPKPYYVGQGLEVRVEVDGSDGSATITPPKVVGSGEILPIPEHPGRFVVIPARPGTFDLPPFRARWGDRSGASRATRLTIANVPSEGRVPAFLGGVGPFEVRAEAAPAGVRTGETFEYRVKIVGPAAWGSVRKPTLSEWRLASLKVERGEDEFQPGVSPSRTFRYRVRPLNAGKFVLPPIAVAAFDPSTRRYPTKVTAGLAIRVEEPARFDPARLDYPPATAGREFGSKRFAGFVGVLVILSGSAMVAWRMARGRRSRAPDPRRLALALASGLLPGDEEVEAAWAVAEGMTTFLHRVDGRPLGVLTPPEARIGFERLTEDPSLGRLAESLVSRCDRARFGSGGVEAEELMAEGRRFFEELAVGLGKGKGPGEAVETA